MITTTSTVVNDTPTGASTGRKVAITRNDMYLSYTPTQKQLILISGAMVAMLTPFCDTVYLPAIKEVATDLNTTEVLTSITVYAYLGAVGVGQLVWGPLSDYYGRLPVLFLSLVVFEAFTIACIFAADIVSLIALRTIEGFIVGSCIVCVQAIISDVFAPEVRGAALSYFLGPMLIGPIIAPLVGGIIAEKFTWRGDFVLLAVMTLPITLFAFLFTPETHHWYVIKHRSDLIYQQKENRRLETASDSIIDDIPEESANIAGPSATDGEIAVTDVEQIKENSNECRSISIPISLSTDTCHTSDTCRDVESQNHDSREDSREESRVLEEWEGRLGGVSGEEVSDITTPTMMMPWTVAAFLFDLELAAYYCAVGLTFACMFTSLTLLPIYIAEAPYNLSAGIVGVTFLPVGVAMLIAALIGGALSDWAMVKYSNSPHGIMIANLLLSLTCPLGTIGFGFCLQGAKPLYAVLITQCILGF